MKQLLSRAILALALFAGLTPAVAQTFPTVPGQSVIGRRGIAGDTGPSQAILFNTLRTDLRVPTIPAVYATDSGVKCDGTTDDAPALQRAINTADGLGGVQVILPAGTCVLRTTPYLNKWAGQGILTVPGLNLVGQGKGVTILDTRVAGGFALAVNPEWKAAHKSLFGMVATTGGGSLGTNTYYVWATLNDSNGNEINATFPKPIAVTGPGGRIAITLEPMNNGYTYNLYCSTSSTPANYCVVNGGNASALGSGQTINLDNIGSARTVPINKPAVWQQAHIADLTITSTVGTAGASGISYFKVGYSDITNAYIRNLLGTGFEVTNYTGDIDGSFNVKISNSKFDTIAGDCVNAAGNVLELSNFTVDDRTAFNICGTLPANYNTNFTISAISNTNPGVFTTSAPHTLQTNDQVYITGVAGLTLTPNFYRVTVTSSTSFNIRNLATGATLDTTSLGAYTPSSGTESLAWRPPNPTNTNGIGGCLRWMGLIGTFENIDFTQCNNFGMYFTEGGTSDNATIRNIDLENTYGKPFYIASLAGGSFTNSEVLTTSSIGDSKSCVQLGTGFAGGGVQNFIIDRIKVRSNVIPMNCWEQFQNTNNLTTFHDTNRVGHVTYQAFDATAGSAVQTRQIGFTDNPIPGTAFFSVSATNTFKLAPIGYGATLPIHLKANGEWIPVRIPDTGVTFAATTSAINTTYNIYAYNSALTSAPVAIAFAADTSAPVFDRGYWVRAADTSQTFVGQALTDGSGNFQPGLYQVSQYPIQVAPPLAFSGAAITCPTCVLISGTARGDANYTILFTDRYVYTSAAFTAPRTWTLPAANTVPKGTTIWIQDAQSTITTTNTLTIQRGGADTIDGGTLLVITNGGGGITFTSDGTSNWGSPIQTVSTGGTGRTNITNHAVMVGAGINPVTTLTAGTNGQLLAGATGADPAFVTMSQDCTMTAAGVMTCTKTNNVSFAAPATSAFAAKTDMQTPSSSVLVVNPRDVQDHPGTAKFWARLDGKTGSTCTIGASYNISGCVRNSVGNYTLTFTTAFTSTNYAAMIGGSANTGISPALLNVATAGYATGTLTFTCTIPNGAVQDCDSMAISGYGSQ